MKLSNLIAAAQVLLSEHGDLEVFDSELYEVTHLGLDVTEDLPEDWNLPDGTKIAVVRSSK